MDVQLRCHQRDIRGGDDQWVTLAGQGAWQAAKVTVDVDGKAIAVRKACGLQTPLSRDAAGVVAVNAAHSKVAITKKREMTCFGRMLRSVVWRCWSGMTVVCCFDLLPRS
jgi:hypothetical protein